MKILISLLLILLPRLGSSVTMRQTIALLTMTFSIRRWRSQLLPQVDKIFLTFMGNWTIILVISQFSLTRLSDASEIQILIFSNSTWPFFDCCPRYFVVNTGMSTMESSTVPLSCAFNPVVSPVCPVTCAQSTLVLKGASAFGDYSVQYEKDTEEERCFIVFSEEEHLKKVSIGCEPLEQPVPYAEITRLSRFVCCFDSEKLPESIVGVNPSLLRVLSDSRVDGKRFVVCQSFTSKVLLQCIQFWYGRNNNHCRIYVAPFKEGSLRRMHGMEGGAPQMCPATFRYLL